MTELRRSQRTRKATAKATAISVSAPATMPPKAAVRPRKISPKKQRKPAKTVKNPKKSLGYHAPLGLSEAAELGDQLIREDFTKMGGSAEHLGGFMATKEPDVDCFGLPKR